MTERKYDLIILGASGYTGRLVAEHMAHAHPSETRWALAGRNPDKLIEVRREIGAQDDLPIIQADTSDPASLKALAESAKVILTAVGPYQRYGEGVVAACVESGTDYVDLCGEAAWMRQMIDKYDDRAKETGARIVFSCGFDSIPSDLGVFLLQEHAKSQFGKPFVRVKGRVRALKGTFSGGTAASAKANDEAKERDPSVAQLLVNPFALTPGVQGPPQPDGDSVAYDEALERWCGPFFMASTNMKTVHRTNMLLGHAYGADFLYDEMVLAPAGIDGEKFKKALSRNPQVGSEDSPKPGEGPSKEERESGMFYIMYLGETADGERGCIAVKGDRDPGYGSTSKMVVESALCMANECAEGPGGFYTPAAAMGMALAERLVKDAGMTFDFVESL